MTGFAPGEVRTGQAYEAERAASRDALAASAPLRRVRLADDLVLVFQTRATVRSALEEVLRGERVDDAGQVAAETAAFAALLAGPTQLAATLFVDVPDPVELADRLTQLPNLAEAVFLELGSRRLPARRDGDEDGSGVFHLTFELGQDGPAVLHSGIEAAVVVDHPACRARAVMSPDQVAAVAVDLAE